MRPGRSRCDRGVSANSHGPTVHDWPHASARDSDVGRGGADPRCAAAAARRHVSLHGFREEEAATEMSDALCAYVVEGRSPASRGALARPLAPSLLALERGGGKRGRGALRACATPPPANRITGKSCGSRGALAKKHVWFREAFEMPGRRGSAAPCVARTDGAHNQLPVRPVLLIAPSLPIRVDKAVDAAMTPTPRGPRRPIF